MGSRRRPGETQRTVKWLPELSGRGVCAGCIAGALPEETYLEKIRTAGFRDVTVVSEHVGEKARVRESEEIEGALLSVSVLAVK